MTTELRWRNYVLGSDTAAMWRVLLSDQKRDVLYVLGLGFDERMCIGIETVFAAGGEGKRDVCLLTFEEGPESASRVHGPLRDANEKRIEAVVAHDGRTCHRRSIRLVSEEGRPIGGRSITREFEGTTDLSPYTDVVVDVSALPRGLYFPLLAKMLSIFDQVRGNGAVRNLHVIVAHSPALDSAIQDEGIDEATFLHGFSAAEFEREATREQPRVWVPVLGRSQRVQLDRILELVKPDEICPVLPSPAQNPRESDDLMLEYRDLLFDQLRVETRNVIYASEANPFEVYRQIVRSVRHYQRALAPLGGCKVVLSAMSSKLSSIGALLAAYELRNGPDLDRVDVGVAHVEAQGYAMNRPPDVPDPTLYSLWLAGECDDN